MFINYRQYILQLGGGCEYNLLHHRTRISSLGAVAPALFVDSKCVFHFYREKTGREADLRFNLWTRWKANTDVRSEKQFQLTSERSLPRWAVMVLADGFLSLPLCYGWHSQGPRLVKILLLKIVCCEISPFRFLVCFFFFYPWVLENPTAQQVGGTRGITDV